MYFSSDRSLHLEIVFLAGPWAISYSETILAIVEHYRLGEIVGEPSAGTNGNNNPFSVLGGLTVTWTGMRVSNYDGSTFHLRGVRPTIEVRPTVAGILKGQDEVLERAVETIRSKF